MLKLEKTFSDYIQEALILKALEYSGLPESFDREKEKNKESK